MDRNIVAFVRDDTRTVHVVHGYRAEGETPSRLLDDTVCTYVCNLPDVSIDDVVIVHNKNGLALATVREIDDEVKIEPNSDVKYAWIVGKVDMDAIIKLQEENEAIEETLQRSYAENVRKSYRNQILNGLSPDVLALLPASVRER